MKKLILHIGIEKTGTSAIQRFLSNNSEKLVEYGYLYPKSIQWRDKSHHKLAFALLETDLWDSSLTTAHEAINQVLDEVKHFDVENLIISSEVLREVYKHSNFNIFKKELLQRYNDITLVVFVRDQIEWLGSKYNQLVKDPNIKYYKNINNFVDEFINESNYYELIQQWKNSLEGLNYQIVVVDYKPLKESVIIQFCKAAALNYDNLNDDEVSTVNTSLTRPAFDLIRHFNKYRIPLEERKSLNKEIVALFKEEKHDAVKGSYRTINPELSAKIRKACYESNKKLDEVYGIKGLLAENDATEWKGMNGVTIERLTKIIQSIAHKL